MSGGGGGGGAAGPLGQLLIVLPCGGGKSSAFLVPALAHKLKSALSDGVHLLTVVVVPVKSLRHEMVDRLRNALQSTANIIVRLFDDLTDRAVFTASPKGTDILVIGPEGLGNWRRNGLAEVVTTFRSLQRAEVRLVVDECHQLVLDSE
jgi:superfamily II DNA helicase RecQ